MVLRIKRKTENAGSIEEEGLQCMANIKGTLSGMK